MWFERFQLAALSFLWLAAIFYPLEWARPAWTRQRRLRPGFWADLCFFAGQHLLFSALAVALIARGFAAMPTLPAWAGVRAGFVELPLVVQAVLAIVLGPLAETSMRQSLLISHGSPAIFFERPIAGTIMVIAIVLFLLPLFRLFKRRVSKPTPEAS